jgi:hypothetical protein
MEVYLCYLHSCYSSRETTREAAGIWTPYQSLVWSLLDILLISLFYSLLQSLLNDSIITAQCLRAAAERWKHRKELSFPYNAFGRWKSISCWKVLHECWQTESTWMSASGTMFTITNTIIITLITMAIIPLTSSLSALDWMCNHTPTIWRLQAADFARSSES